MVLSSILALWVGTESLGTRVNFLENILKEEEEDRTVKHLALGVTAQVPTPVLPLNSCVTLETVPQCLHLSNGMIIEPPLGVFF